MIDLFEGRPTYLFGCNEHSAALAGAIKIDGIVDDFRAGERFAGHPIVHGDSITPDAIVINCVLMARGRIVGERMKGLASATTYDYSEILAQHPHVVPAPVFMAETRQDIKENAAQWERLRNRLSDEQSRKVLDDLIAYRTTARLDALADYEFAPKKQYFDKVVEFGEGEVFVDCGGFDGDTTEEFIKRCPGYSRVYLFEPSPSNLDKARARLTGYPSVEFIPEGVSDSPAVASFDASSGSASAISDEGSDQIVLTTIDGRITGRVTFIKMDLEGWELKALEGARQHIQNDHPKLAIAVYHHPSDFWRIPELVLGMREDYSVYLRHYTEGWVETVMYFIPHSN